MRGQQSYLMTANWDAPILAVRKSPKSRSIVRFHGHSWTRHGRLVAYFAITAFPHYRIRRVATITQIYAADECVVLATMASESKYSLPLVPSGQWEYGSNLQGSTKILFVKNLLVI
jgi:hypothetical protein